MNLLSIIHFEEAIKISRNVTRIIENVANYSVTNLLRRCARIAELLNLEDIHWINNELKGYPDDDVPLYRQINAQCQYGWFGSLNSSISSRRSKEEFYKKWEEEIIIRQSSIILEKWSQNGHSFELRQKTMLGINVKEKANVKTEQYEEILHRITDKIREFVSEIIIKHGNKVKSNKKDTIVTAFISASFNDEINDIITWFKKVMNSLDIDVIWLKDTFQARPVAEKIKENLKLCNCFVLIITKQVYYEGREAGWIGNEIAWATDSTPGGNMAVFVEKGTKATGIGSVIADNLEFDFENITETVPKIIQFLVDLKSRVVQDEARVDR